MDLLTDRDNCVTLADMIKAVEGQRMCLCCCPCAMGAGESLL